MTSLNWSFGKPAATERIRDCTTEHESEHQHCGESAAASTQPPLSKATIAKVTQNKGM